MGWLRLNIKCRPQTLKSSLVGSVENLLINGQEAPTYIARHPILISRGLRGVEVSLWSRYRTLYETNPSSSNQYINLKFNHYLQNLSQNSLMLMSQALSLVREVCRCSALGQTKTLRGQATRPRHLIVYLEEVCMRTPRKRTSSDVEVAPQLTPQSMTIRTIPIHTNQEEEVQEALILTTSNSSKTSIR